MCLYKCLIDASEQLNCLNKKYWDFELPAVFIVLSS